MNSDFEELLSLFTANGVRYLVVGGHAVMLYTAAPGISIFGSNQPRTMPPAFFVPSPTLARRWQA